MRRAVIGSLVTGLCVAGACMAIREAYGYKPPFEIVRQAGPPVAQIQQAQEFVIRLDTSQISGKSAMIKVGNHIIDTITAMRGFAAAFQAAFYGHVICTSDGPRTGDGWAPQPDPAGNGLVEKYRRDTLTSCPAPVVVPGGSLQEEGIQRSLAFVDREAAAPGGFTIDVVLHEIRFNFLRIETEVGTGAWIVDDAALVPDQFYFRVIITDRQNGAVLYDGDLVTTNYTIDTRLKIGQNMRWRGLKLRLFDGANNLAWMVTNVMKNGAFVPIRSAFNVDLSKKE